MHRINRQATLFCVVNLKLLMDMECRLDGRTWHINLSFFYNQILVPHVYGSCLQKISLQNLKYAKDLKKVFVICDFCTKPADEHCCGIH